MTVTQYFIEFWEPSEYKRKEKWYNVTATPRDYWLCAAALQVQQVQHHIWGSIDKWFYLQTNLNLTKTKK